MEHGVGLELERRLVGRVERDLDLGPRDRRRHGGTPAGPQRVGRDRGLVLVVLAPVDEHLAGSTFLGHHGGDAVGRGLGEDVAERERELLGGVVVGAADRDRDREVQIPSIPMS